MISIYWDGYASFWSEQMYASVFDKVISGSQAIYVLEPIFNIIWFKAWRVACGQPRSWLQVFHLISDHIVASYQSIWNIPLSCLSRRPYQPYASTEGTTAYHMWFNAKTHTLQIFCLFPKHQGMGPLTKSGTFSDARRKSGGIVTKS